MTPELQQVTITYVVPALIMAYLEVRRRRLAAKEEERKTNLARRVSDFDMSSKLRDELYERWNECNESNETLRKRVAALEHRTDLLTDLLMRHGVPIPPWEREA